MFVSLLYNIFVFIFCVILKLNHAIQLIGAFSVKNKINSLLRSFILAIFLSLPIAFISNSSQASFEEGIFVFPEENRRAPFIHLINKAMRTIRMAAYKFEDDNMCTALLGAANRGVKITILKEPNIWMRPDLPPEVQGGGGLDEKLAHENIKICPTPSHFNQTHSKMILVDDTQAIVTTSNFTDMDDPFYRDFGIVVTDPNVLKSLQTVFDADTNNQSRFAPQPVFEETSAVWGPDHQRPTLLKMIMGARHQIYVFQQSLQDPGIARALAEAAKRNVSVRVIMTEAPFKGVDKNIPNHILLKDAGAKVMLCNPEYRYIHAKVLIVDGTMYVGSCNFYTPSIDETRELGILTPQSSHVERIIQVFEQDWEQSKPFKIPEEETKAS